MLVLWLLFKDIEKNLMQIFGKVVNIQSYTIGFTIKGITADLIGTSDDFRRGICKVKIGIDEYTLPEEKYRFLFRLKGIPLPTQNIPIPEVSRIKAPTETKPRKREKIFGESVEL